MINRNKKSPIVIFAFFVFLINTKYVFPGGGNLAAKTYLISQEDSVSKIILLVEGTKKIIQIKYLSYKGYLPTGEIIHAFKTKYEIPIDRFELNRVNDEKTLVIQGDGIGEGEGAKIKITIFLKKDGSPKNADAVIEITFDKVTFEYRPIVMNVKVL